MSVNNWRAHKITFSCEVVPYTEESLCNAKCSCVDETRVTDCRGLIYACLTTKQLLNRYSEVGKVLSFSNVSVSLFPDDITEQ